MPQQLSNCCKAYIRLTGEERPNAFACVKCGRIIGTDLPQPTTNNLEGWGKEFDKRLINNGGELTFYKTRKNSFDDEYKRAMGIADNYMVLKQPLEIDSKKIKQFISELRKRDKEELIKMFEENGFTQEKIVGYKRVSVKQLIQDYYNK